MKPIGLYQGHISVHSFTFCVRMSVCSLVFAGVQLGVRRRLQGGKRSSGVCRGSVCVLTLADGWCVCVCVCVYACGQWAQLEGDCATEAEDPEKQSCLTKIE